MLHPSNSFFFVLGDEFGSLVQPGLLFITFGFPRCDLAIVEFGELVEDAY